MIKIEPNAKNHQRTKEKKQPGAFNSEMLVSDD